jgi:hypothetical protein
MSRNDDDIEYVDVECVIKHETEKAYLIEYDEDENGDAVDCWVPKSQVGQIIKNGTTTNMEVAEWFAEKNGLI